MRRDRLEQLVQKGELWFAAPPEHRLKVKEGGASFTEHIERSQETKREFFEHLLELRHPSCSSPSFAVPFGAEEIDNALPQGGLPAGALHEWCLLQENDLFKYEIPVPHLLLSFLAAAALKSEPARSNFLFWVGRKCRPAPFLLARLLGTPEQLSRCVFLDPPDRHNELWAIETILRSGAAAAVVASLQKLSLSTTRRLALAARHGGALALLVRPASELSSSSAALTRWIISPQTSQEWAPRFQLELARFKGHHPPSRRWEIEFSEEEENETERAPVSLRVLSTVGDRSGQEREQKERKRA